MAHAWPPLLKTICTPSTDEPPKSPFLAKVKNLILCFTCLYKCRGLGSLIISFCQT